MMLITIYFIIFIKKISYLFQKIIMNRFAFEQKLKKAFDNFCYHYETNNSPTITTTTTTITITTTTTTTITDNRKIIIKIDDTNNKDNLEMLYSYYPSNEYEISTVDHGGFAAMTWSLCDHHPGGARMTCGQSPHHGGFAAMTSERSSDQTCGRSPHHGETMTWSLCDHLTCGRSPHHID
jgi:hypothetical protein